MSEAAKIMLERYEGMRVHCLRMANYHPDSREACHQSLCRVPTITNFELHLAGLLDDMALAIRQMEKERLATPQSKDGTGV